MKQLFTFFLFSFFLINVVGQVPSGYYNSINNLKGRELQLSLYQLIKAHRALSYTEVWIYYKYTDAKLSGKIWDIYSDNPQGTTAYEFDYRTGQCITIGNQEGICYTREHSFCQSWFGGGSAAPYTDVFHLYPVDGYINTIRNNNPYGIVTNPTRTFSNGSKMGMNTFPSAPTVTCFEPIDDYKGDIARTFFYMATRYMLEDENFQATSPMTFKSQLQPWAFQMFWDWHNADPVSEKELARNNSIYAVQHNRNPFIDFPELASKIWTGDSVNPFLISPTPPPQKPKILWFALTDNHTLKFTFDRTLIKWTAENSLNYSITASLSVTSAKFSNDTLEIKLGGVFSQNANYSLTMKHILAENMAFLDTTVNFFYPYNVEQKPLISWTFDNLQPKPNTEKVIPANYHLLDTVSEAVLFCNGSYQSSDFINGSTGNQLDAFGGTTLGDPRTPAIAGNAIAFANTSANGKSAVFKFPTRGYFNLAISLAVRRTATGFDNHQWEWSLDGENYDIIENTATCPAVSGSFVQTALNLSAIEELNHQDSVFLRLTLFGATGATGNNRLDNITLRGVSIHSNINIENKNKNKAELLIIPNPTNGIFAIRFSDKNNFISNQNLQIFDLYGRLVYNELFVNQNINIAYLQKGIYVVKIGTMNGKLVKN